MRIGSLDRHVTFQSATRTADSEGQPVATWADLATAPTVWANFSDGDGRGEFPLVARTVESERIAVFTVRHRTDITEQMRIVFDSENWNIHRIKLSDKRSEHLAILASVVK